MKAFGYTLLLTLLIIPHVNVGQDFDEKMAEYKANRLMQEFSIVAGPSVNFLRGSSATDNGPLNERQYLIGYSFGMQVGMKNIIDQFSLSAGLFYERKGGKSGSDTQYWDPVDEMTKVGLTIDKYKYNYYTFTIRPQYAFGQTSRLKVGVGGYVSYLEKQMLEIDRSRTTGGFSIEDQTKSNAKTDYGLSASISYRIVNLKPFCIDLYLINNLGLKNTRPGLYEGLSRKTNNTVFLIGLTF